MNECAPLHVVQEVERFVASEIADVDRYLNRSHMDDSAVYSLHRLAATIYAMGSRDGWLSAHEEASGRRRRVVDYPNNGDTPLGMVITDDREDLNWLGVQYRRVDTDHGTTQ